ncbi:hypothetical protein STEG23_031048, partial [Scotinomys teguina]
LTHHKAPPITSLPLTVEVKTKSVGLEIMINTLSHNYRLMMEFYQHHGPYDSRQRRIVPSLQLWLQQELNVGCNQIKLFTICSWEDKTLFPP